ncbi:MAG: hypothetical protein HC777_04020 [Hyphomonadaceae bacterium]|nr:hypothetical protein [Hyphomonadaceae bacterium]
MTPSRSSTSSTPPAPCLWSSSLLSAEQKTEILRESRRKRSFVPIVVRENLGWEEVARVEFNAPDLPGITIDVGSGR